MLRWDWYAVCWLRRPCTPGDTNVPEDAQWLCRTIGAGHPSAYDECDNVVGHRVILNSTHERDPRRCDRANSSRTRRSASLSATPRASPPWCSIRPARSSQRTRHSTGHRSTSTANSLGRPRSGSINRLTSSPDRANRSLADSIVASARTNGSRVTSHPQSADLVDLCRPHPSASLRPKIYLHP